jgi:hypothetical protein
MSVESKSSKAGKAQGGTKPAGKTRKDKPATTKIKVTAVVTNGTAPATGDQVDTDEDVAADEALNEELRKKVEAIRKLAQRADLQEIELRYEIGVHCRDVIDGDTNTFGEYAAQKLVESLEWTRSLIYDYASVARNWEATAKMTPTETKETPEWLRKRMSPTLNESLAASVN